MNKLIDELAQKAEDYADDTDLPWLATYTEKFAELLIKECIGAIELKMPEFTCKEEYDNLVRKAGRMDAIDEIKEHFGVEE